MENTPHTITIRSKCHDQEVPIPFDMAGERHYLSAEELLSVEVTGRSRWQDYADTPSIPHRTQLFCETRMDMATRPGRTPPGCSPPEEPWKPSGSSRPLGVSLTPKIVKDDRYKPRAIVWHLRMRGVKSHQPACGERSMKDMVFGFDTFAGKMKHKKACAECAKSWLAEQYGPSRMSRRKASVR